MSRYKAMFPGTRIGVSRLIPWYPENFFVKYCSRVHDHIFLSQNVPGNKQERRGVDLCRMLLQGKTAKISTKK